MAQLELFPSNKQSQYLETLIEREGNLLKIPEGLHTTPCNHGIHKFAGKFIPNLPRYLFREVLPHQSERVVLDPFCGSGTTLLEAALEGKQFIGLDIDPLSVAISRAKIQLLSEEEINLIDSFWRNHDFNKIYPESIPNVPNLLHWFKEETIAELSSIKYRALELPPRLSLFSLVVFSSIIRRVSNADDQTQKTYVSHTLPKNPPLPSTIFPIFLNRAIEGMRQYSRVLPFNPNGVIKQGDAITDIKSLEFDDVITSPPYIDSIDYVYNQMLEYFWLLEELGIDSYESYKAMRKRPMGFRVYDPLAINGFFKKYIQRSEEQFEQVCQQIGNQSPKEELTVRSFFFDYACHVEQVCAKQSRDGIYVCVVGNSLIRGVNVPTVDFIESIHLNSGYELVDKFNYEIRRHYMKFPRRGNSGKIKNDYILVFRVRI
ncbi:DNA methyltransferase [Pseudanabaena sp. ABRG5-3]|uniref:DNA methyltransferase n=1 Tax=Pseudanabaena sp. ABRG5-3 TaxID=685565 RepID=UPI000DC71866|nr:DNA methyltransferase [Pseudanabaena sp. ABRG5-3]BBC26605.1 cytosine (N4) specific methyltransferase [Pseudanabaena sp. ABRG5-3]